MTPDFSVDHLLADVSDIHGVMREVVLVAVVDDRW